MSDDLPSGVDELQQPKSKEDQKAAAALESLNTDTAEVSGDQSPADREALGKAMSRLDISGGQDAKKKTTVKVSSEDVGLLVRCLVHCHCRQLLTGTNQVDQLDLNKAKATELLKANDGDIRKAIGTFISPVTA